LKKGFALLDLGRQSAGVKELQSLVARFPRSPEATQARERLRKLGAPAVAPPPPALSPAFPATCSPRPAPASAGST